MDRTSIGDRMKIYEAASASILVKRMPAIIRVDGRAFHTFTRTFARPFDVDIETAMESVAHALCEEVQGAKLAYTQSDEVSVLVTDYDTIQTQPWLGGSIQKIASIAAAVATSAFTKQLLWAGLLKQEQRWPQFDARVFNIPREDVVNYFIWRQQDASRTRHKWGCAVVKGDRGWKIDYDIPAFKESRVYIENYVNADHAEKRLSIS